MTGLKVRLFGGFEVCHSGGPSIAFPTRKARALFALLARYPGQRQAREALAAMFWPDSAETVARSNLRQALKLVRRAVASQGGALVTSDRDAVVLEPERVDVDVDSFERLYETGTPEALKEAAELYRGDFLEGTNLAGGRFSDWLMVEQVQLREHAADVFARLHAHRLETGETGLAIDMALKMLTIDPLQEHIHRRLMQLYLDQGRRGAALEQYRRCCDVLQRELGVRPEPETERLHQALHRPKIRVEPVSASSARQPDSGADILDPFLTRPAVAVLPFTNLNEDPAQTYFTDGLSEDIITALASWRCFPLIASSSAFAYRNWRPDWRGVASDLGARYLVDGTVRRSDRKLRISAHVIDAITGRYIWAESFNLELDDVLTVQEEAARRIAATVEPELEKAALRRIVRMRTEDLTAWDHVLQGSALVTKWTAEDNARARSHFRQAIRLDASYSDAFMGLANGLLRDIFVGAAVSREQTLAKGFEAAREAVALDTNSSSAHLSLGHAYVWAEDYASAVSETELAVELNPSNAHARMALGNRLDLIGKTTEGIAQMMRSLQLNPRDPTRFNYMGYLARAHITLGEYEKALQWARKAAQLRPDQPGVHFRLAVCLGHQGLVEEAKAALAECERLQPGFVAKRTTWRPYSDEARNEHFFAGLRRLGLFP